MPTRQEWAWALLTLGVGLLLFSAVGVLRDIRLLLPVRWQSPVPGGDVEAVPGPVGCFLAAGCREPVLEALRDIGRAHAPGAVLGTLALAGSCAWLGVLRRRVKGAHFAAGPDLIPLTRRGGGAWFPLGYVPRWGRPRDLCRPRAPGPMMMLGWRRAWLPEEDLARHVLVVGLTGAGKTSSVTMPVLLEAARAGVSVVAFDLKYGEDDSLARAAVEWQRRGRDVLVFAPLDPSSLRWNPLAGCRTLGDGHHLASLLFDEEGPGGQDALYWVGAERHLCAVLCFALSTDGRPPTLARLRAVCEGGPSAVQAYVQSHPASAALGERLGAYRAMLPKDEAGVLQGIASRLEAWGDDVVCRTTGAGSPWEQIRFDRLRRDPVLLLVGVPQQSLPRLRGLCRAFFADLEAHLLRPRGPGEEVRVVEVLEELPAWGPLPDLADHLATFRSRRVCVLATIQSEAQGEAVYGRSGWGAIAANLVTKVYCSSLEDADAARLSRALGLSPDRETAWTYSRGSAGFHAAEHHREVWGPLLRPQELQGVGVGRDEVLVRCARRPPLRVWCPPFSARPEYRGRAPERPPSTADLAVYHHLRYVRTTGGREDPPGSPGQDSGSGPGSEVDRSRALGGLAGAELPDGAPAPTPASPGRCLRLPRAGGPGTAVSGDSRTVSRTTRGEAVEGGPSPRDVGNLLTFFAAVVQMDVGGQRGRVRSVYRGARLLEIRISPEVAMGAFGTAERMYSVVRRWAAWKWVRRVRPVFVLERPAIEMLTSSLRAREETSS
jgi:type IV secretory pathway TraG/TraD family ATPase VirD4